MKPGDVQVTLDGADAILAASALRGKVADAIVTAQPRPGDDEVVRRARYSLTVLAAAYERVADALDPRGKRS